MARGLEDVGPTRQCLIGGEKDAVGGSGQRTREDGSWVLVTQGEGLWEYGTCTPYPLLMLAEISTLFIALYMW